MSPKEPTIKEASGWAEEGGGLFLRRADKTKTKTKTYGRRGDVKKELGGLSFPEAPIHIYGRWGLQKHIDMKT